MSIFPMGDRFQFLARSVSHLEEEENRAPQPLIQRLACPAVRDKNRGWKISNILLVGIRCITHECCPETFVERVQIHC